MNATLAPASIAQASAAPSTKPLWAAVGVLGICVLAMGATLVHVNHRPEPLAQAALPLSSALAMNASNTSKDMITEEKVIEKPAAKPAPAAPKALTKTTAPAASKSTAPAPVVATAPASPSPVATPEPAVVAQAPAKPACNSCGTVEAVTPVTRDGQGSGVGVVAGGVVGGVLGNQVGKGNGRTAATVLGAIGGGWAGNAIEKNMKKTTVYAVRVRMEDGSSRTIEQASAPTVGSKVTVDGGALRPA